MLLCLAVAEVQELRVRYQTGETPKESLTYDRPSRHRRDVTESPSLDDQDGRSGPIVLRSSPQTWQPGTRNTPSRVRPRRRATQSVRRGSIPSSTVTREFLMTIAASNADQAPSGLVRDTKENCALTPSPPGRQLTPARALSCQRWRRSGPSIRRVSPTVSSPVPRTL
jgi:hypothetical protein